MKDGPDNFLDRASLSKDPNSRDSQMYAQLAHALVNFLGMTSPQDMADFGMQNAADLVDLISRVCLSSILPYILLFYFLVHHEHIYHLYSRFGTLRRMRIANRRSY